MLIIFGHHLHLHFLKKQKEPFYLKIGIKNIRLFTAA